MTLLIVDDHAQTREIMKTMFADLFDEIYECSNGAEALVSYARHHQDWTLMDIEMPVCDGIAATLHIKANFPDARIIILTAHDSAGLRKAASEAGAHAYVLKDDLSTVRVVLNGIDKRKQNETVSKAISIVGDDD